MRKVFFFLALAVLPVMAQTGAFDVDINEPGYFKVAVPDGNYKVTVTVGAPESIANCHSCGESQADGGECFHA